MKLPSAALAAILAVGVIGPAWADDVEACQMGAAQVSEHAKTLPSDDLSRRFAEFDIATALTEMEAGEVDECPELLARAREIIETRPYHLRPGERLLEYQPDVAN